MNSPSDTAPDRGSEAAAEADPFVGRERLLEELRRDVREGSRVELLGVPGVGKSTLARRVVDRLQSSGRQWAVFDVRPHRTVDDAVGAMAERWSVEVGAVSATSRLAERIGGRLESRGVDGILLDNADIFARRPGVLRILDEHAFGVTWMTTTRLPLEADVDRVTRRVPGLSVEAGVDLYRRVARRHWVGPGDPGLDEKPVRRLVERLDGHPQALEFAASQIVGIPPATALKRLDSSADRDSDSRLEAPPPLRRLVDDAWDELIPRQREILVAAAQFAGPAALELLEATVRHGDPEASVVDEIDTLARSGWLRPDRGDDRPRTFEIPNALRSTLREPSREGPGESTVDRLRRAHATTVVERAAELERELLRGAAWSVVDELQRLAPEMLTVFDRSAETAPDRAARALLPLRWLVRLDRAEASLRARLGTALSADFLEACDRRSTILLELFAGVVARSAGRQSDAADRVTSAHRRLAEGSSPEIRAEVALEWSHAPGPNEARTARERAKEAHEAARRSDQSVRVARAAERLGYLAVDQFDLEEARDRFGEARRQLASVDDGVFRPSVLTGLGYVEHRLDLGESALSTLERAVELHEESDRRRGVGRSQFNYGVVLWTRGDPAVGAEHLRRAATTLEEHGTGAESAAARIRLGLAAYELDEIDRARTQLRDALALAQNEDDRHNQALAEASLAALRDEGAESREFDIPLRDLDFRANSAAAAAFLAFAAVCAASADEPDRATSKLRALEDLAEKLTDDDAYNRRTVDRILEGCRSRIRGSDETSGVPVDADNGWARLFGRLLEQTGAGEEDSSRIIPAQEDQTHHLRVHERGHWFSADGGEPVDLTSRDPLRRILAELVRVSTTSHRDGATVDDLIEAGWPEASPTRSSGANRVYYSIRKLREMDLEEILVTADAGYRFDPSTTVRISDKAYDALEDSS